MATVDPDLKAKFEQMGEGKIPTLVTFNGDHEEVALRLNALGMQPKDSESKHLGIFCIDLAEHQLSILEDMPDIEYIEYDQEASAFE